MKKMKALTVGAASIVGLLPVLVGCGSSGVSKSSSQPQSTQQVKINPKTGYPEYNKHVTLTWWTWIPNASQEIKIFEKYYPTITVKDPKVQAGSGEYAKLATALSAKSGAPDVAFVEYQEMPQFIESGGLLDISKYNAAFKKDYPDWVWNQVSYNGKLYGMPKGIGPVGLYYRPGIFSKYNLSVPKTWKQFSQDAIKLHEANPKMYFTYMDPQDGPLVNSVLWQAGVYPFKSHKNGSWTVKLDTPAAEKTMSYWQQMVDKGAVYTGSDTTPAFKKKLADGDFACAIGAAWWPSEVLNPVVKVGQQKWKATFLPQWSASGKPVDSNIGGAADVVTTQTKHPRAAALFAAFINTSKPELKNDILPVAKGGGGFYSATLTAPKLPEFDTASPILDGKHANKEIFSKASKQVGTQYQWSPWTQYYFSQIQTVFGEAFDRKITWKAALQKVQQSIVHYGKSQGYKISS